MEASHIKVRIRHLDREVHHLRKQIDRLLVERKICETLLRCRDRPCIVLSTGTLARHIEADFRLTIIKEGHLNVVARANLKPAKGRRTKEYKRTGRWQYNLDQATLSLENATDEPIPIQKTDYSFYLPKIKHRAIEAQCDRSSWDIASNGKTVTTKFQLPIMLIRWHQSEGSSSSESSSDSAPSTTSSSESSSESSEEQSGEASSRTSTDEETTEDSEEA